MKKKILRIPLFVVAALAVGVLALYINGTCGYKGQVADASYSSWMEKMPDETLLRSVKIPGSHDAGTYGMIWPGRTQNYDIATQLSFGARYFDVRVNKTEDGYRIYHSSLNGVQFSEVLNDIKSFIKEHPSETLLLDFQHFKGGSKADVLEILSEELEKEDLVLHNNTKKSDVEFMHSLTLGEARGKCIIFFGETNDDPSDWIFLRNDDGCTKEDRTLDSFYLGDMHKAGFEKLVGEAHPKYLERLHEKQQSGADCIFILQCQLTDGKLIFGPWPVERGQEKKMDEYVRNLRDSSDFDAINVIMRDYLTPEKCADIIGLNTNKDK